MTIFQAVVVLLVDSQIPTAEPTASFTTIPTAEPTDSPRAFKNRALALAIAIIIIVLIVCCCCGCCFRNQIKARYEALRYGNVVADGGQQPQYQQQGYGGTTASAQNMPMAQATINPGGGMGMVFGPDGKPI